MSEAGPERTALLIDDNEVFRLRLSRALADRGWEVWTAEDGRAGLELARTYSPDLAVVDLRMPGVSGLDTVKELRALDETTCIIMLTGYGSIATALTATKLGASHYLSKPVDADQILSAYQKLTAGDDCAAVEGVETPSEVPSLARVEWEHIQRVLTDCEDNVSKAAKLLGLHRRSLQRKLSKYPPRS